MTTTLDYKKLKKEYYNKNKIDERKAEILKNKVDEAREKKKDTAVRKQKFWEYLMNEHINSSNI